ncbi:MAG: glycosyltransferase family 2 protein [Paludibacteraceae bacterium]|nr:glycosyltransferase family 2 protein [Candidatus Physcocola equi]MCQ2234623.1 glycosyltransferase family 2 protein [Paludibacteraceae bacterium]
MEQNISVVINTYNAEKYLERVLKAVQNFDEIVVCDMESTDSTVTIAEKYGAHIVTFPKGNCKSAEPARTFAIQSAKSDWVLVVDADEIIPTTLHDYLYEFIKNPGDVRGLYIPRKNYTLGTFLPSSYPDYQLRFFIKEGTIWPPHVHTFPKIQGKVDYIAKKKLELAMIHLDDSTKASIIRLNNYTENEVEKRNDYKKVTLLQLMFVPWFRFFKSYILKGGFRYGIAGYVQAKRSSYYKFTMLCKIYEKQKGLQ